MHFILTERQLESFTNPQSLLQAFPRDYTQVISQAQAAVEAAIADGALLLEVEFPTAGLATVAGDAEGANEMTYSLGYLRKFCRMFQDRAAHTRIYFPDKKVRHYAFDTESCDAEGLCHLMSPFFAMQHRRC